MVHVPKNAMFFYIIFYFGRNEDSLGQIKRMDDECLNALLWHIGASVQFFLWFQQDFGASFVALRWLFLGE